MDSEMISKKLFVQMPKRAAAGSLIVAHIIICT